MKSGQGIFFVLLISAALLLSGCAKEKHPVDPPDNGGDDHTNPPPDDGDTNEFGAGAEAPLTLVSVDRLAQFANHPINQAQNVKINVNLDKFSNNRYGGYVTIAYTNNGIRQAPRFGTGGPYAVGSTDDVKYNLWFTKDGVRAFHAFFEDSLGAVVLVVDHTVNFGDGNGNLDVVGGSVWFKNFEFSYAPKPTRCWFIEAGPYDCRTFKVGNHNAEVSTTSSIYPNNGEYKKLGTFENMSKQKAFNE